MRRGRVLSVFAILAFVCVLPTLSVAEPGGEVTAEAGAGAAAVPVSPVSAETVPEEATPDDAETPPPPAAPPSTWASLGWQLAGYVIPILGALLTALVGFGIQWIRAKTSSLRWQSVLDQLEDAVDTAVAAVQQTTVDALKAASADGKLTAAERDGVFLDALTKVKMVLGTKGLAALQSALQAGREVAEAYLREKIEAAVAARKVTP